MFKPAVNQTAFAKIGSQGKPGSGKTTLLALLALYLSKTYHNGAPVAFIDSEKGSDFVIPMFKAENVPLLVQKTKALIDLRAAAKDAMKEGACCVIADSVTKFWMEAMQALKAEKNVKRLTIDLIGRLKDEWTPFADDFVESKIHFLAAGRLGYEWESAEYEDENGNTKKESIRGGTKMKTEGDFGHDFDLSIEMAAIEDPDALQYEKLKKKGVRKKFTASGLHVATVKKCRVWALNGKVFRWPDQDNYQLGYYKQVAACFKPYFDSLNIGGSHEASNGTTSNSLFQRGSEESYTERKTKVQIAIEKWDATMDILAGGQKAENKKLRQLLGESITGTRSKTEFERQPLHEIEKQVAILMTLERKMKVDPPQNEADLQALVAMCQDEIAMVHVGAGMSLLEVMQAGKVDAAPERIPEPF